MLMGVSWTSSRRALAFVPPMGTTKMAGTQHWVNSTGRAVPGLRNAASRGPPLVRTAASIARRGAPATARRASIPSICAAHKDARLRSKAATTMLGSPCRGRPSWKTPGSLDQPAAAPTVGALLPAPTPPSLLPSRSSSRAAAWE